MSNSNKTEINKRYGELVRMSVSNVIDDTAYGMTGLNHIGNEVNHTYSNATTASNFTLTDVNTQPNRNYNYYTKNVLDNVESLYPKIIN